VALLCASLLVGMAASAIVFGLVLRTFSEVRLIQVIQGAAVVTVVLNSIALWKQEPRNSLPLPAARRTGFVEAWNLFARDARTRRRLVAIALGTAGFSMQDILLEPYGGKILGLPVGATTTLTAMLALGGGLGLLQAARRLNRGADPHRVAGFGALVGVIAFAFIMFAAPLESAEAFGVGVGLIGFGGGLFAHGGLTASMASARADERGLALGAWGAAQATAAGLAIAFSGLINDAVGALAVTGALGEVLAAPVTGYCAVYAIEILLLLAAIVAIGPLSRRTFPAVEAHALRGSTPLPLV
jgi:BCD family chlorophyll transporter-like MFS transporter